MAQRLDVRYVQFYTDGSAARKVAPAAPIKTIKLPKIKKAKRPVVHIDPVSVAAIFMAAVMLVLLTVGVVQLRNAEKELYAMEAYVNALEQENIVLNAEFTNEVNLNEVEQTALALGLVPVEDVRHVTLKAPEVAQEQKPGAWESFYIFLTGLFA